MYRYRGRPVACAVSWCRVWCQDLRQLLRRIHHVRENVDLSRMCIFCLVSLARVVPLPVRHRPPPILLEEFLLLFCFIFVTIFFTFLIVP